MAERVVVCSYWPVLAVIRRTETRARPRQLSCVVVLAVLPRRPVRVALVAVSRCRLVREA
jgi:hypothetical protein